jgi:hypothetical protein
MNVRLAKFAISVPLVGPVVEVVLAVESVVVVVSVDESLQAAKPKIAAAPNKKNCFFMIKFLV